MKIINTIAVSQSGKVRNNNEDALLIDDNNALWLVADGMGGHACGEVASDLAIQTVKTNLSQGATLKQSIITAHHEILTQGQLNPQQKGMGTTLVAVQKNKHRYNISWAGDSRVYFFANTLQQLTNDHTFVQDMVFREVLTPEEAETHDKNNLINRSLGMENGIFKVDSIQFKPKQSGLLFLCTDGVSDYVNNKELAKLFEQTNNIQKLSALITSAVMATAAGDNFSFILIEFTVGLTTKWRNFF